MSENRESPAPPRPRSAASFNRVLFQSFHHALELVAVDGLQPRPELAQQQHAIGIGDVFDQVIGRRLELEGVVQLEPSLDSGIVDQRFLRSRYDCSRRIAATRSTVVRRFARLTPPAINDRSAATEVRRSSTSSTGIPDVLRSASASLRADFASGPSEPSMRRGSPTTMRARIFASSSFGAT